jgi:nucleotide-binding universal stress UspA family protein
MQLILAAIDESQPAHRAAVLAGRLAAQTGAKLLVLNVVEPLWVPPGDEAINVAAIMEELQQGSRSLVRGTAARLEQPGLAIEPLSVTGSPAITITDLADARGADLVVLGSTGNGAVARALLGSVADRVLRICTRPVLVVH